MTEPSEKNLLLAHDVLFPTQRHYALGDKLHQGRSNSDLRHIALYLDERDAAAAQREVDIALLTSTNASLERLMRSGEQRGTAKGREEVEERLYELRVEHEAQRAEVERVVDEVLRIVTPLGNTPLENLLRSLIRAKPEPDLLEQYVRAKYPNYTEPGYRAALAADRKTLDKLGLELTRKGGA